MNKYSSILNLISPWVLFVCIFCFSVAKAKADDWEYVVRKGDNLWNLAVDHLIDISYLRRLQKMNNIADPWHILPGTIITIPSQWIRQFPALLRVQNLQGTAQILDDGADVTQQLKVGAIVMLGDTVITDADSTLVLGFLDGSQIMLGENSRLKVEHLMSLENTGMSDSQLKLESGRLETQVIKNQGTARHFQIKTPATVTSVRGTDYRVSAELEKKESRTEVVEGKVGVKGGEKNILLPKGFGTVTKKNQVPLPPVKLLPAPDISSVPSVFFQVPIQFAMPGVADVKGYRLQLAKTPLFQDVLFDKSYVSTNLRGPDLPDGDYHIRLRALDGQYLEGYNAQHQITINARPESPFLVSPKPGVGIVLQESPEFSWSGQKEISLYHLQIATDEEFSDIVVDQQSIEDTEFTISENLDVGKYYWRLAGIDDDGDGPFSDAQMFRRILPAPDLEAPEISDDSLTIRSRSGLPGQTYHFQMAENDDFNELLVDERTDQPMFEIPLPDGGEYFIRVRTIDPDGFIGPFSAPQSISVPYNLYWLLTLLPLLALLAL